MLWEMLVKHREYLERQRETFKFRIKKLTAKQADILKKSTVMRETISKKYEDIVKVLEEDLKVTLDQLEAEAKAAVHTIDCRIEKCHLIAQDIEQELAELSLQQQQNKQQSYTKNAETEERVIEVMNISNPDSVQLDDFKSSQLLSLINNLQLFIRAQIPVTRKVFQSYTSEVVLDPKTAHPKLVISPDGISATFSDEWQELPDSPVRFDTTLNVISTEGFSEGRHYWEVDVGGKTYWELGVTYPSISRKGREEDCWLGRSGASWCVEYFNGEYTAWHDGQSFPLPINKVFKRIGVYVSYPAGIISFHGADSMMQLFTFCAGTFTDILHPAVCPGHDNEGTNRKAIQICSSLKT
ncbi:UNVERIFIED_CONTAM: hypothetical protein FKN15_077533 [Acipenser sinensis]